MNLSKLSYEEVLQNTSSGSILGLEGFAELYEHMKLEKLLLQHRSMMRGEYYESI